MAETLGLLAIGNPCVDLYVHTPAIPGWDDKCAGTGFAAHAGGTEANVACAASRLGLKSAVFGAVGDDLHAAFLIDEFARYGVSAEHLQRLPGRASATTVVLLSPAGERSIIWLPLHFDTAQPPWTKAAARRALATLLPRCRVAYTMPYALDELAWLAGQTARLGTLLAIDVERAGAQALKRPGDAEGALLRRLLAQTDLLFMNESGFVHATGAAPTPELLRTLLAGTRAQALVVSLGARGAVAADRAGAAWQTTFPAEAIDTTGAGDTFNAAFLCARLDGQGLPGCLAFACAAASRTVAALGARSGLPTRAEVQALLAAVAPPPHRQ